MLWAWLPVVVLGQAAPPGAQYVQASMMNVRSEAATDAQIVVKLRIGTPVAMTPLEGGEWCRVGTLEQAELGFAVCALAGPVRPTLESVQSELDDFVKRAGKPGSKLYRSQTYRDLIARKFFLSPSVYTIEDYNQYAHGFYLGACDTAGVNFPGCRLDSLGQAMMDSYQGDLDGVDWRPVRRTWNRSDLNPDYGLTWNLRESNWENPNDLPEIKSSFFDTPDAAYLLGGWLEIGRVLRRGESPSPGDSPVARYVLGNMNESGLALIEFLKLLPGVSFSGAQGGRTESRYGKTGLGEVGSIEMVFPMMRPPVWLVTSKGISTGSVSMVKAWIGMGDCGAIKPLAHLDLPRPIDRPILVALIPNISPPNKRIVVKRIGDQSWNMDLDGDGVFDLAYRYHPVRDRDGDVTYEGGVYFINIAGKWRSALVSSEPICT